MPIERYGDYAIVPVWNPKKREPREKELSNKTINAWNSGWWYWCEECEMAVCSDDLPNEIEEGKSPLCPVCNHEMEDFDWEGMLDCMDDSWMFPNGHDDGESIDTMFGDDE